MHAIKKRIKPIYLLPLTIVLDLQYSTDIINRKTSISIIIIYLS